MTELTEKEILLESAGYTYHFGRMIYFNRGARKAFSLEFIEDHPHEEIRRLIGEPASQEGWVFYFNEPASEGIKRQLAAALDQ
jgi:hypothetical protein